MTVDTLTPPAASEEAESLRRLSSDFQATFSTESGQRVLRHILNKILFSGSILPRSVTAAGLPGPMSGEDALYMMGCKDAAIKIRAMLNMEFTDDPRPTVVRNRFTSRK